MALEIERKFLLKNDDWKKLIQSAHQIKQGYLNSNPNRTVRIRLIGQKGIITIKGITKGTTRLEFEYEIPKNEAEELILLCENPIIQKTRNIVLINKHTWEIDVFDGVNKGLAVAEIELTSEDEKFEIPEWVGKEVSYDNKYFNASLIKNPYCEWK